MSDAINPEPRGVLDAWEPILDGRRPANQGHPVKTDRGNELVFTVLATGRDLDDLRAGLGAWRADRERLALAKQLYEALAEAEKAKYRFLAGGGPSWPEAWRVVVEAMGRWREAATEEAEATP